MWGICFGTSISCPVNAFYFYFGFGFWDIFAIVVLFLGINDLTLLRGFAFNFYFLILFKTTGLVFIYVSVVSSDFNNISFVLTVGATRTISDPNIFYSKISQIVPLSIISPRVVYNWIFKGNNTNTKSLWSFNLFALVLCPIILTIFRSCCKLVSRVVFQRQTDRTIIFPKLCLLLLSFQNLSRSGASKERTKIQRVPYVWTFSIQCYVFHLCGTLVCWVCLYTWVLKVQFDDKCTGTSDLLLLEKYIQLFPAYN